jgi:hypothetical protein
MPNVWQPLVGNVTLQAVALLFSLLSGVVLLYQGTTRSFRFLRKYKRESLDSKIRILKQRAAREIVYSRIDGQYFLALAIHHAVRMAMWATLMIVGFVGLATLSSRDEFYSKPKFIITDYDVYYQISTVAYLLSIALSGIIFFYSTTRLGIVSAYVKESRAFGIKRIRAMGRRRKYRPLAMSSDPR